MYAYCDTKVSAAVPARKRDELLDNACFSDKVYETVLPGNTQFL